MKQFLVLFALLVFMFTVATPAQADAGVCNRSCQVSEDCGQGYRCYADICRATLCPSSLTCGCTPVNPTPASTVRTKVTVTPYPKATPIASASAQVKETPKTGSSIIGLVFLAVGLAAVGVVFQSYGRAS